MNKKSSTAAKTKSIIRKLGNFPIDFNMVCLFQFGMPSSDSFFGPIFWATILGAIVGGIFGLAGGILPYVHGVCTERKKAVLELHALRTAMSMELKYLLEVIGVIAKDIKHPEIEGKTNVPVSRLNSDFLGDIRLYGYKKDPSADFHECLASAYKDILHTNGVLELFAKLIFEGNTNTSIKLTLDNSLKGVTDSVSKLKNYIDKKLG